MVKIGTFVFLFGINIVYCTLYKTVSKDVLPVGTVFNKHENGVAFHLPLTGQQPLITIFQKCQVCLKPSFLLPSTYTPQAVPVFATSIDLNESGKETFESSYSETSVENSFDTLEIPKPPPITSVIESLQPEEDELVHEPMVIPEPPVLPPIVLPKLPIRVRVKKPIITTELCPPSIIVHKPVVEIPAKPEIPIFVPNPPVLEVKPPKPPKLVIVSEPPELPELPPITLPKLPVKIAIKHTIASDKYSTRKISERYYESTLKGETVKFPLRFIFPEYPKIPYEILPYAPELEPLVLSEIPRPESTQKNFFGPSELFKTFESTKEEQYNSFLSDCIKFIVNKRVIPNMVKVTIN